MEERIIDKDELRKVRVTRTDGERDVVDDMLPEGEAEPAQEEYSVEFDGETYDEDLVGLTPAQYREEIERRERAAREAHEACEKLCAEGEERLAAQDWAAAEECFEDALREEADNARAEDGLWTARTKGYTSDEVLYLRAGAEAFAGAGEAVRAKALAAFGEDLRAVRREAEEQAAALTAQVEAGQAERRGPFLANRNYYRLRLYIALGVFAAMLIGLYVSASFILRVQSAVPVVLTGAFGALAFVALAVTVIFARKTLVAVRLCRENERLSSTEEGRALETARTRLYCLGLILGDEKELSSADAGNGKPSASDETTPPGERG